MRPRFVVSLLMFAALVLGAAFYFKSPAPPAPPDGPTITTAPATKPASPVTKAGNSFIPTPAAIVSLAPTAKPMTSEEKQTYIEAETGRLQEWSTQDDSASFNNILNDLTNVDKDVRLAAIEAAKQFGNRDAIPILQADAASATDTDEKIALLEAADFLALPTIAEVNDQSPRTPEQIQAMQQSQARAAARRQYLMQKHAQNGPPPMPNPPP